jgi:hypothetical protein
MIHAFESDDLRATRESSGESHRVQHGLGTGIHHVNLFDARDGGDDFFRKVCFIGRGKSIDRPPPCDVIHHGLGYRRRAMAEEHGPQAKQVIDVLITVNIE